LMINEVMDALAAPFNIAIINGDDDIFATSAPFR
jgi:hypothetical protein